jgi:hypothetical protein
MFKTYPDLTPQYLDKAERLHKMGDEFVTILTPVDLHYNMMNLDNIVLSVGYGVLSEYNFFNIIHKYDFEISNIIYDEESNLPPSPSWAYGSKLLICLVDRKEYID